ncbi:MAG: phosphate ABC transporter ATP-binding protein PstB [Planctomycetaceae bacterium]
MNNHKTADRNGSDILIRNLSIQYNGKNVLRNVSLTMPHGEISALLGPSGCGKTSLLNSLNRLTDLISGCAVSGEVFLGGREILREPDVMSLRRQIGMVFQNPNPFPFSIRRNFELPLKEHGIRTRSERESLMQSALHEVGLWEEVCDRLDESAQKLSGGQQQRLCIARALSLKPKYLLFDEPCSALDPISGSLIEELIASFRGRYTVVLVTHQLAQARRLANQVAVFGTVDGVGRLIESGSCEQIFNAPEQPLTKAYVKNER